ncbi:MAG TPA: hypothetical protein DD637_02140, partial [Verrucomicrobia bacterium]|nr:hypothetical protein [Verrucomicrobiota bacterium]
GVILVQTSRKADFRMRFFNPDGSSADLCGNGARCVAAFAREIGAARSDSMRFETDAGEITAQLLGPTQVRLAMPAPRNRRGNFIVTGVPHQIVEEPDLGSVDVVSEGRRIRNAPAFAPEGTNVDFVHWDLSPCGRHPYLRKGRGGGILRLRDGGGRRGACRDCERERGVSGGGPYRPRRYAGRRRHVRGGRFLEYHADRPRPARF